MFSRRWLKPLVFYLSARFTWSLYRKLSRISESFCKVIVCCPCIIIIKFKFKSRIIFQLNICCLYWTLSTSDSTIISSIIIIIYIFYSKTAVRLSENCNSIFIPLIIDRIFEVSLNFYIKSYALPLISVICRIISFRSCRKITCISCYLKCICRISIRSSLFIYIELIFPKLFLRERIKNYNRIFLIKLHRLRCHLLFTVYIWLCSKCPLYTIRQSGCL